jgi:hypothetical protein
VTFSRFPRLLPFLFIGFLAWLATEALAQTTPTHGESQVGDSCSGLAHSTDFDTLVQCTTTAAGGTLQKAPLFIGAVTAPPYANTTCDSSKAGMLQYTASAMQYCNGSTWTLLGSSASGLTGQSLFSGFPDAIVCTSSLGNDLVLTALVKDTAGAIRYESTSYNPMYYAIQYNASGTLIWNNSMSGYDCVTNSWTIANLISNGRAFNFVNGGGGVNTMVDGTAAAPGLYFSSDPNTGLYRPTTDTVAIATAGTERLRVTATGSVGIGTTSPEAALHVASTSGNVLTASSEDATLGSRIYSRYAGTIAAPHVIGKRSRGTLALPTAVSSGDTTGSFLGMGYDGVDYYTAAQISMYADENWTTTAHGGSMAFRTVAAGTTVSAERMRIASNGHVGIGTTTPFYPLTVGSTSGGGGIYLGTYNSGEGGEILIQGPAGYDSWYIDSYTSNLRFFTGSANNDTVSIFNSGTGVTDLSVEGDISGYDFHASRGNGTGVIYFAGSTLRYLYYNGSTYILPYANLTVNGTTYTSDRRLKEDIQPIAKDRSAMEILGKLDPKRFHWKPESEQGKVRKSYDFGMIAQDVQKILPEIVVETDSRGPAASEGEKQEPKSLNEKLGKILTIDYTRLIPWLLAGLQEVAKDLSGIDERVAKLEAENEKLKAANDDLRRRLEKLEGLTGK